MIAGDDVTTGPRIVVDAAGPDDAAWCRLVSELPVLDPTGIDHLVIVAAHPDDETLGVGGLLQLVVTAGARVDLVAITDGEASHPGHDDLAGVRRRELRDALSLLGIASSTAVHHLAVPDGRVSEHAARVEEAVASVIAPGSLVLAPALDDGHPDHEAAGRAATTVAREVGSRLLTFPIWAWQSHDPATTRLLDRAWRVPLRDEVLARKRRAIHAFESQVGDRLGPPVVPAHVLARLLRNDEVLVAPCG